MNLKDHSPKMLEAFTGYMVSNYFGNEFNAFAEMYYKKYPDENPNQPEKNPPETQPSTDAANADAAKVGMASFIP